MKSMRLIASVLIAAALTLFACSPGGQASSGQASSESSASASGQVPAFAETSQEDSAKSASSAAMTSGAASAEAPDEKGVLIIEVNGTRLEATFEDNTSAEALADLLREGAITVSLHDYGGFEKVGPLPTSLPSNDSQITTVPGDVILYQGDQITIYYDQNTWSFTKLAHIDGATRDGLLDILGDGDVTATLSLAQ